MTYARPVALALGLSHSQFEAMIVAARTSTNPFGFVLVAMLGLLRLRVFEACSASVDDLGEDHGHRVLRSCRVAVGTHRAQPLTGRQARGRGNV